MVGENVTIITGNAKVLRSVNRGMILNMIREMQPISRINIAKLTGLNKSTVSSIVSELLNEDLIYEKVSEEPNVGRNPLNLYLKLNKYYVGAINIDSSITRFAVADIDGSIKGTSSINTESKDGEKFVHQCINELGRLSKKLKIDKLEGIGVSIAGIVDPKNSIVNFAPNLGWEDFNIGEVMRKYLPDVKNITIGNDAKSSALAELWFGSHEINLSNFVFLSIGPGIGSGIVVENKLIDGEYQASGEFGHTIIYEGGELCTCGNRGCWEAYASDRAIVKRYAIRKHSEAGQAVDFMVQDIINLAKKGDELAIEILKQTGYYLGLGIANIIKAIDPHAIIIGGKITQVWDLIYPDIMKVVMQRAFFGRKKNIKILPTSMKVRPRLLGAATLAIKEIFDGYKITG
jgi:N-acetylglucosamine repressor